MIRFPQKKCRRYGVLLFSTTDFGRMGSRGRGQIESSHSANKLKTLLVKKANQDLYVYIYYYA